MNASENLFTKHEQTLKDSLEALKNRTYYSPYPENPKAYAEDADQKAKAYISSIMNNNFTEINQNNSDVYVGEEISPYLQLGIGVKYGTKSIEDYIADAESAGKTWAALPLETRTGLLIESLERIKSRFFDIAYATMHTTGQGYMMSFQASGPHSNDRALEAIATGYRELSIHVNEADWVKPMGKFELKIKKTWKAIPRGTGLVIGCSTFPVWNTLPGLFANLIVGSPSIVKPHPKAILPIAIVIAELQKLFNEFGLPTSIVQLAPDTLASPITKNLSEHHGVKTIDYTGSSIFGEYIESLNKTVFTEKAGVNSVIIDSASDLKAVVSNLAFSASLYSGQMCTAPQNIFVPASGIKTNDGIVSFDDFVKMLTEGITGLADNPKAGAPTLGAIQSEVTLNRIKEYSESNAHTVLVSKHIKNEEFADARTATPVVLVKDSSSKSEFNQECFGPILFVIKTNSTEESVSLTKELASTKGAITCGAYTTNEETRTLIENEMNAVFTPVSFNFTGAAFINSHAAFSDYHVTGGNAAGNASLISTEFIVRRFVWVGNRYA